MANSADLSQMIWIQTVCKGRAYPGSAGQGLRGLGTFGLFSAIFTSENFLGHI